MIKIKISGIYKITCIPTGKVYVGSAKWINKRFGEHKRTLNKHIHYNHYLQRAWNKYGQNSFNFEILELVIPIDKLFEKEQYWLDLLKADDPTYGFNIRPSSYFENDKNRNRNRLTIIQNRRINEQLRKIGICKLTENQIKNIKQRILNGETNTSIAKLYCVRQNTISRIKNGKRWGWVLPNIASLDISSHAHKHQTKLSKDQVILIREKLKNGHSCKELAKEFNISRNQIYKIRRRDNWNNI